MVSYEGVSLVILNLLLSLILLWNAFFLTHIKELLINWCFHCKNNISMMWSHLRALVTIIGRIDWQPREGYPCHTDKVGRFYATTNKKDAESKLTEVKEKKHHYFLMALISNMLLQLQCPQNSTDKQPVLPIGSSSTIPIFHIPLYPPSTYIIDQKIPKINLPPFNSSNPLD